MKPNLIKVTIVFFRTTIDSNLKNEVSSLDLNKLIQEAVKHSRLNGTEIYLVYLYPISHLRHIILVPVIINSPKLNNHQHISCEVIKLTKALNPQIICFIYFKKY